MNIGGASDILDDGAGRFDVRDEVKLTGIAGFGEMDLTADPGDVTAGRIVCLGVVRRVETLTRRS